MAIAIDLAQKVRNIDQNTGFFEGGGYVTLPNVIFVDSRANYVPLPIAEDVVKIKKMMKNGYVL